MLACDKAISELKNLVRIIVNEFGGTNILITADHGFLYTYSPLKEEDKVDKRGFFDVDVTNSDITKKESIKAMCGVWQKICNYAEGGATRIT